MKLSKCTSAASLIRRQHGSPSVSAHPSLNVSQYRPPHRNLLWEHICRNSSSGSGISGPEALLREMTQVAGVRVVRGDVDSEDDETYDDIQEEMDDPWMARPAPLSELELAPFAQLEQMSRPDTSLPQSALPSSSSGIPSLQHQDSTAGIEVPGSGSSSSSSSGSSSGRSVGTIVQISKQRLHELQALHGQDGVCILDVRSLGEHSAGCVPGSVNIPIAQLDASAAKALQDKAAVFVVVDPGDYRGQQACVRLTRVFGFAEALLLGLDDGKPV